ncbi:MAG TPA: hypothetical protein VLH13_00460 [Methanomassiliicoccales archaeon]|nr:hypothetical protein [Methanomassiliicoccales archaeon]
MTTRVKVNAPICDHEAEITVQESEEGLDIRIITDCKSVQHYSEVLRSVTKDEVMDLKGSPIIDKASDTGLTATCLIPTAVFNACWLEMGMISKGMARSRPKMCIEFIE